MKAQLCYELLFCLFFGEAHPNHGRWTCLWSPSFDRSDVLVRWKHQSHHRRNDKEEEQQVLSETRIDCTNDLTILYGNKATEEDILPSSERRHSLPPSSCLCTSWKLRLAPIYSSRNIHQHIERTTHSLLERRERNVWDLNRIGRQSYFGYSLILLRWGGGSHDDGERAKRLNRKSTVRKQFDTQPKKWRISFLFWKNCYNRYRPSSKTASSHFLRRLWQQRLILQNPHHHREKKTSLLLE